jgi:hypothetical protein
MCSGTYLVCGRKYNFSHDRYSYNILCELSPVGYLPSAFGAHR